MTKPIRCMIVHPMDEDRGRECAVLHNATLTISENWPPDAIGLWGSWDRYSHERVEQSFQGWRVTLLEKV